MLRWYDDTGPLRWELEVICVIKPEFQQDVDYQGAKVPTSHATCSIGHKGSHTLPENRKAILAAGFDGIELSMSDILAYCKERHGQELGAADYDAPVPISPAIRSSTDAQNLKILMRSPSRTPEAGARAAGSARTVG